jgi:hypothetical protein
MPPRKVVMNLFTNVQNIFTQIEIFQTIIESNLLLQKFKSKFD